MRINRIKNRNLPVFFFSKLVLLCLAISVLASCKSKTDWRDKYKKEQNTKHSGKNTGSNIAKPGNIEDFSRILDVEASRLKNKDLYSFILEWYGTPYQFGGQTMKGIDCSGFANVLYQDVYKIQLPRTSKDIAENIKRKYTDELKEGDLVFFSFGKSGEVNHVGIYLHNNRFVHASTSKGVIISDLTEPWYGNYLVKCGSFKK